MFIKTCVQWKASFTKTSRDPFVYAIDDAPEEMTDGTGTIPPLQSWPFGVLSVSWPTTSAAAKEWGLQRSNIVFLYCWYRH
jgi:hypothetical protein